MAEYGTVDPTQHDAEERLGRIISRVLVVAAVVAAVGLIAPWGDPLAWAAILVVGAIPIARVGWLAWRWMRIGDMRYVGAAVLLLVLIAAGPVVALLAS